MNYLRPFLIALQFLTVLPIRNEHAPDAETIGRSLLYYPLVGLLIGLLLALLGWSGSGIPANIHAGITLFVWVALTGALHLDGLADSADAWVGGLGDRQKTLAIMKDSYCGPIGVVALILVLLVKFVALEHIIRSESWFVLTLAPVLGRTTLVLLFITTPYVRPKGLGSPLAEHLPRGAGLTLVLLTFAIVISLFGVTVFWLILILTCLFITLRAIMLRRIDGTTGDTAGAMVEISETVLLLAVALMHSTTME